MVAQTSLHLDVESAQAEFSQDVASGRRTRLVWFLQGAGLGLAALMLIGLASPFASHASAEASQHTSAFNPAMPVFAPGIRSASTGMHPDVAQSSQRNPSTVLRMTTEQKAAHEANVKHAHSEKHDEAKHGEEFKQDKAKHKNQVKRTKAWEKEQAEKTRAEVEKKHHAKVVDETKKRRRDAKDQLKEGAEDESPSDEPEVALAKEIEAKDIAEEIEFAKKIETETAK